ncbi:MAG TPA: hypothetical protein VN999_20000, partial [Thermoanaerobaculia bacterium]|nr:hypothetical protein [Thermoanaerobaculia bacterium]
MLAEMPRQVLYPHAQLKVLRDARMMDIEARIAKRVRHRIVRAAPLKVVHQAGKTRQGLLI